ncbi:hypothetical protein SDC9_166061 [bioreactor metagenome]|uniref:Uncharacterized protein n=1 Tax=bioreactor metagenome TaxID=1076179 RepID=A0A645FVZ6_9ZZZZ
MLIKKSAVAFARWQKNSVSGKRALPYAVFPLVNGKPKRVLRRLTLIALIAFVFMFSVSFVLMAVQAKAFEFWHVWGWFNYMG